MAAVVNFKSPYILVGYNLLLWKKPNLYITSFHFVAKTNLFILIREKSHKSFYSSAFIQNIPLLYTHAFILTIYLEIHALEREKINTQWKGKIYIDFYPGMCFAIMEIHSRLTSYCLWSELFQLSLRVEICKLQWTGRAYLKLEELQCVKSVGFICHDVFIAAGWNSLVLSVEKSNKLKL